MGVAVRVFFKEIRCKIGNVFIRIGKLIKGMDKCPFTGVGDMDCFNCTIFDERLGCPILDKYFRTIDSKFEVNAEEIVELLKRAKQKD